MYAALNFWPDTFLINLLVQDMEQKLWLYIRARGAKISSCMLPHYFIPCLQRDSGVAVLGVMPPQAPVGVTKVSWPPWACQGVGQLPPPPASLWQEPLAWAGWVGLEAVPGGQAGSAELWLALYANGSAIIYSFGIHYNRIICDRLIWCHECIRRIFLLWPN